MFDLFDLGCLFMIVMFVVVAVALYEEDSKRKIKETERIRFEDLALRSLSRDPLCMHTPCNRGVEIYRGKDGDPLYVVECFAGIGECDGKHDYCQHCLIRDAGIHELRCGWTPEEELQPW